MNNRDFFSNDGSNIVYLITNNNIAYEFLSRGLIYPREIVGKYYSDLLELVPGGIPLFASHIHPDFGNYCVKDDTTTLFPVLFEISLSDKDLDGLTRLKFDDDSETANLYIAKGVIPLSKLNRILFVNNEDQQRFNRFVTKKVEGINTENFVLEQSDILDDKALPDLVTFENKVEDEWNNPSNKIDKSKLRTEDKIAGSILATRKIFKHEKYDKLLYSLIAGLDNNLDYITTAYGIKSSFEWSNLDLRKAAEGQIHADTTDGILFSIFLEILTNMDYEKGFVFDEVSDKIIDLAGKHLPSKEIQKVASDVDHIRNFMDSIENKNTVYSSCNYKMTKVFLFFSEYATDIERFIKLPEKKDDFEKELQYLTAFLLGYFYSQEILPRDFKIPEIEILRSDATASRLNANIDGSILPERNLEILERECDKILKKIPSSTGIISYFKARSLDDVDVIQKAVEISDILGLDEFVETRILTKGYDDEKLTLDTAKNGRRKAMRISFRGIADIEYGIIKEEFFDALQDRGFEKKDLKKALKILD